jgi:DNA-binding transcriptional MocR family regulator
MAVRHKPYNAHKRGAGRHVQLSEYLQATEAWASLKPGPRALYIELKRRFNGTNNGDIFLSHRDAALALGVNRNTVGAYFYDLADRGFIRLVTAPHLGPAGVGIASKWALEEEATRDGRPAQKAFIGWRKIQNPRTKNGTPRPKKQACGGDALTDRPKKQDGLAKTATEPPHKKQDISTSSHRQGVCRDV